MDIIWLIDFYSYYIIIFLFTINGWLHLWQSYILYKKKSKQRWGVFIFFVLYAFLGVASKFYPGHLIYGIGLVLSMIGGVGLISQWKKDEGSKKLSRTILIFDIVTILLLIGQLFIF